MSVLADIFYLPNFGCFDKTGVFQQTKAISHRLSASISSLDFIVASSAYTRRVICTVALSLNFARITNSWRARFVVLIFIRHCIETCPCPGCEMGAEECKAKETRPML